MTWSYVFVPLGTIGIASLLGLGLTIWTSWRWAVAAIVALAVATIVLVTMALTSVELSGIGYGVFAFFVTIPAAFGVAIGAMIATRKDRRATNPGDLT